MLRSSYARDGLDPDGPDPQGVDCWLLAAERDVKLPSPRRDTRGRRPSGDCDIYIKIVGLNSKSGIVRQLSSENSIADIKSGISCPP